MESQYDDEYQVKIKEVYVEIIDNINETIKDGRIVFEDNNLLEIENTVLGITYTKKYDKNVYCVDDDGINYGCQLFLPRFSCKHDIRVNQGKVGVFCYRNGIEIVVTNVVVAYSTPQGVIEMIYKNITEDGNVQPPVDDIYKGKKRRKIKRYRKGVKILGVRCLYIHNKRAKPIGKVFIPYEHQLYQKFDKPVSLPPTEVTHRTVFEKQNIDRVIHLKLPEISMYRNRVKCTKTGDIRFSSINDDLGDDIRCSIVGIDIEIDRCYNKVKRRTIRHKARGFKIVR